MFDAPAVSLNDKTKVLVKETHISFFEDRKVFNFIFAANYREGMKKVWLRILWETDNTNTLSVSIQNKLVDQGFKGFHHYINCTSLIKIDKEDIYNDFEDFFKDIGKILELRILNDIEDLSGFPANMEWYDLNTKDLNYNYNDYMRECLQKLNMLRI